ncbi:MAG: sulfur-carrier protein adenylyltransferase/sulfurtransferase [Thermoplasmata archaeon]|nr:sulfur-carrier protein adenylyltransferase/sulfurtransferase [Thermoplasmata archaeon]
MADLTAKLSNQEIAHYARHLILPEVGMKGQERLKDARVLVVGTGGLGAPASLYLAAAGVGTLGLVDFDRIEASNLHRQVLFSASDVGKPKVKAAAERLRGLNPHVTIHEHDARFTSANAHDLLRDYDIILDGTDNFPTRYLANDVSVLQGKPNVYASIFRFEGQASVFDARKGPCYRCLYAKPPPPGLVPSCAEGGVLGVLPGIMGSIQASEAIKLIIGRGEPLIGKLLLYDALDQSFTKLQLAKDPACPICGKDATITELIDYEEFCGIRGEEEEVPEGIPSISAQALAERLAKRDVLLVDVREPHEAEIARIPGAKLVPLNEIAMRAAELPQNEDIVLHCRSGVRSARALALLQTLGFKRVWNLDGGILAWSDEVDPSVPKY